MRKILVTGGAGYIGSIAVKKLIEKGYNVVVVDNLSKGNRKLVHKKAKLYVVDTTNKKELFKIFKRERPMEVMHFASYKAVGESQENPAKYSKNQLGTRYILEAMAKYKANKIIFSSSAAVYGNPKKCPLNEEDICVPTNYYGHTKKLGEDYIKAFSKKYNIKYISLRYFNVIGDGGLKYLDPEPQNILPIVMEAAIGKREKITIFGEDYPTRDGTCIRDYIDVNDLVDAHIKALQIKSSEILNLGTEKGMSVKELINLIKKVTKKEFKVESGERRKGDPAELTASNKKARELLNWEPQVPVEESIKSMYKAYVTNQNIRP